jgi:hypothetical protein
MLSSRLIFPVLLLSVSSSLEPSSARKGLRRYLIKTNSRLLLPVFVLVLGTSPAIFDFLVTYLTYHCIFCTFHSTYFGTSYCPCPCHPLGFLHRLHCGACFLTACCSLHPARAAAITFRTLPLITVLSLHILLHTLRFSHLDFFLPTPLPFPISHFPFPIYNLPLLSRFRSPLRSINLYTALLAAAFHI